MDNFEITGYNDAFENGVYRNSKIVGYPKLKNYVGPMWDGDKVRYESLEAYKFFSEAKSHLRNVIKEAFSDYYNFNHFDNDNLPDDEDYEMVHEAIDFNTFVDICHSHGWDYHNTMDVTNKNGANGVRYIFSSSCNNNFPFEELVNELKSKATDPDGVIPSMGTNRNAPEMKSYSIIVLDLPSNNNTQNESILREGVNNQNYTHFAILKPINKIVNGWDYSGYDSSELRQYKNDYFLTDIKDYGFNPKDIKILTKQGCLKQGINPDDDNMWDNGFEYMQ